VCEADGAKLVVIDTPPHGDLDPIVAATSVADFVVIPVRPGILDVEAVAGTVDVLQRVDRPGAFVLSMARPRHGRVEDAKEALKIYGLPTFGAPIVTRADFQDAMIFGKTARELHPKGKAAAEIAALWNWIRRRL